MSIEKLEALLAAATPNPTDVAQYNRNVDLIDALVNAAPELLAVVRAAKEHGEDTLWLNQGGNRWQWVKSHNKMMDALEALEAKLGDV